MSAVEILESLRQMGVVMKMSGDRLKYAPAGIVSPELRAEIVRNKPEIIKIMNRNRVGSIVRPAPIRFNNTPRYCPMENCPDGELQVRGPLFLCSGCGCWYSRSEALSEDLQVALDERAAIREFDGGLDRTAAEIGAAEDFYARKTCSFP